MQHATRVCILVTEKAPIAALALALRKITLPLFIPGVSFSLDFSSIYLNFLSFPLLCVIRPLFVTSSLHPLHIPVSILEEL